MPLSDHLLGAEHMPSQLKADISVLFSLVGTCFASDKALCNLVMLLCLLLSGWQGLQLRVCLAQPSGQLYQQMAACTQPPASLLHEAHSAPTWHVKEPRETDQPTRPSTENV